MIYLRCHHHIGGWDLFLPLIETFQWLASDLCYELARRFADQLAEARRRDFLLSSAVIAIGATDAVMRVLTVAVVLGVSGEEFLLVRSLVLRSHLKAVVVSFR